MVLELVELDPFILQVGNHVDVQSSKWTAEDGGIGPGVDSYFEYLLKGAILFDSPRLLGMFEGKGDDAF